MNPIQLRSPSFFQSYEYKLEDCRRTITFYLRGYGSKETNTETMGVTINRKVTIPKPDLRMSVREWDE